MSHEAPTKFRPFVSGEERILGFIRAGGQATTPYWNGLNTAARNFNHLLAYSAKPLVEQHGSATISWTSGSPILWASYVVRSATLHNRRTVRVEVTATTTTATQFRIYGRLEGQSNVTGSLTASGGTCTIDVGTVDGSIWDVLTLGFDLDVAGSITVTDVRVYATPTTSPLPTTRAVQGTSGKYTGPVYTPQDVDQYDVDDPLSVNMMSDLSVGLQGMYHDNVGAVVNWSWWGDRGTYLSQAVGLLVPNKNVVEAVCQYIYYPRPGAKYLTAFVAAHLHGYTSHAGEIRVDWRGASNENLVPVTDSTTSILRGDWAVWEYNILVPDAAGPLYLEVRGRGSSDGDLVIQGVAIYENPDGVE